MTEDNDDRDILGTWRTAMGTTVGAVSGWIESRSSSVRMIVAGVVGFVIQEAIGGLNESIGRIMDLAPTTAAGQLSSVIVGLILMQSFYFYRRFNRLEEEVKAMDTSPDVRTDGGTENDFVVLIGAAFAGLLIGTGLAQYAGYPDLQLAAGFMAAYLAIKVISSDDAS